MSDDSLKGITPIQVRVRKLVAVAAQATVAARVAAAVPLNSQPCVGEYFVEHGLLLHLGYQPGAAGHVVVQHDGVFGGMGAAGNRDIQVRVWNIEGFRRAEQHGVGDGIGGPLAAQSRKLEAHHIRHQFMAQREPSQGPSAK